ncbi:MAG: hypothetical protein AB1807_06840 [Pseudomonadota bacterium]
MRKHLLLFLLASTLSIHAAAQLKPTTKQECTRRCSADDVEFPNHPSTPKHKERLRRIQEQRQNETDPEKLKALAKAEEEEMNIRKDEIDQICRWICRHNPEE